MQTDGRRVDWPTLVVGGIFLAIGLAFGIVAAVLWYPAEEKELAASGRPARAEVLRKTIGADRASGSIVRPAWRIEYRFAPPGAAAVTATAQIDAELWKRLSVGDPVELVYLPSDASVHRVEGRQSERVTPIVFGLIFLVFAPLGAWLVRNALPGAPAPAGVLLIIGPLFALIGAALAWLTRPARLRKPA